MTTLQGLTSNLTTIYNTAVSEYTTAKSEFDTAVTTKSYENSLKTKMNNSAVTAANDKSVAQAGSAAALKATADSTLAGKVTALDTARDAWAVEAKKVVELFDAKWT